MIRLEFQKHQSQVVSGETGGQHVSGKGVVTIEVGGLEICLRPKEEL